MDLFLVLTLTISAYTCTAISPESSSAIPPMSEPSVQLKWNSYDYIIVGGGTAGCPLAATLSQRFKVLVLERGGFPDPISTRRDSFLLTYENQLGSNTLVQGFVSTDGVRNGRARVLGGGSSINAGFYNRASPQTIADMGLDGSLANASFQWVERIVASFPELGPYQRAFRQSLLEAGVTPDNGASYDFQVGTQTGGTNFDSQGFRRPASICLFTPIVRTWTFCSTHKLSSSFSKVQSLRVHNVHNVPNRQIQGFELMECGALGSPQLLLLSGIGPADHLTAMGIKVVLNATGVGQQMRDNPTTRLVILSPSPVESSLVQAVGITAAFGTYIEAASGAAAAAIPGAPVEQACFGVHDTIVGDLFASGQLDVRDNPIVTFNYFQNPQDLATCVAGVNRVEEAVLTNAFRPFVFDIQPLPSGGTVGSPNRRNPAFAPTLNATIATYCVTNVATIWHYHGGCVVGQVVDSDYRVLGTQGLRVVDGSTFVFSPGTNPQATVMMLGRYVGVKILADR
ncbi:hypothetical protein SELMODRAFT_404769 [Selaginella moellendorffii]|uniref:Glucose-methanol-choline oxidoreductase N-terminal domain-containing protein n=1 Tax=Selaginella moellendorffii TaxID=88036 RepID=D8QWB9_SELML|nr:hypothetical protein SELMODRAFT_404769 [Selaginella moellendorffii]